MALPGELYTAEQVRAIDASAVRSGISGYELMCRAGGFAFNVIMNRWPSCRSLLIFAGTGNNGGDGYVVARIAHEQGLRATVYQCGDVGTRRGEAH